jgi:hypothetical protein
MVVAASKKEVAERIRYDAWNRLVLHEVGSESPASSVAISAPANNGLHWRVASTIGSAIPGEQRLTSLDAEIEYSRCIKHRRVWLKRDSNCRPCGIALVRSSGAFDL